MKKKILFVTLSCLLLFSGVVSAANLWGTYKGNQIIRLTVDGDPVKVSDVPVISYNGRTMIPIYLLQQAGINYTWDQNNQTVDIQKTNQITNSNKDNVRKASLYKNLADLGDLIMTVKESYDLSMLNMLMGNSNSLNTSNDKLNGAINTYNGFLNRPDVVQYTPGDSDISQVMKYYYDAIDKLKEIDNFIRTTSMSSTTLPLEYKLLNDSTSSLIYNGINLSDQKFSTYIYESIK
ncbi:hypothetical protein D3C74_353400 [compost metagenome]